MDVGHRRRRRRAYGVVGSVIAVVAVVVAAPVAITFAAHPTTQRVAVPSVPSTYKPPAPIPAFPTSSSAKPRAAGLAAPTNCSAEILPIQPGARTGVVTGADPSGRYLVGYDYKTAPGGVDQNALLWTDGNGPTVINASATDERVDVNSHGVVVGSGIDTVRASLRWPDGICASEPSRPFRVCGIRSVHRSTVRVGLLGHPRTGQPSSGAAT
jgi:hypothetical protein